MASANCRKEVNFALSRQKPLLTMVLEPTKLPLGMELQLSAHQSVLCFHYATEELFLKKLCDCPDMDSCRGQKVASAAGEVPKPKSGTPVPEDSETLRRREVRKKVLFWGNVGASVAAAVGALMLMAIAVLLFANYHQENLLNHTPFPAFPAWFAELLPGMWKELPEITSPEFWNLENLSGTAWLLAAGWFFIRISNGFDIPHPVEKLISSSMMTQVILVVAHFALCAYIENTVQLGSAQWEPLYFPMENLAVIGAMAFLGHTAGRIFQGLTAGVLWLFLREKSARL